VLIGIETLEMELAGTMTPVAVPTAPPTVPEKMRDTGKATVFDTWHTVPPVAPDLSLMAPGMVVLADPDPLGAVMATAAPRGENGEAILLMRFSYVVHCPRKVHRGAIRREE
jgi:hypothetical protein